MKRRLLLLVTVVCLFCGGCVRLPGEEYAFVLALLMDKSAEGSWTACARIPDYQAEGSYTTLTGSGTTADEAMASLNAQAPMRLHFGQLRTLILGSGLSDYPGTDRLLIHLTKTYELRCDAVPLVCPGDIRALSDLLVPETGKRLSKSLDVLVESRAIQGAIPDVTITEAALSAARGCMVLPVITTVEGTLQPGGALAWQEGHTMPLTAEECALYSLLRGDLKRGIIFSGETGGSLAFSQARVTLRRQENAFLCAVELWLTKPCSKDAGSLLAAACQSLLTRASAAGLDLLGIARKDMIGRLRFDRTKAQTTNKLRSVSWTVTVLVHEPT